MLIYILYLVFIILCGMFFLLNKKDEKIKKRNFLIAVFLGTFLLYSLRDSSVGTDVPAYIRAYLAAGKHDWLDFDYIYFESGYTFLMKVCSAIGLSSQGFLSVVSAIMLIPIFLFIYKFSRHPFVSVMAYVCYMYFEFNLTGIRQGIASSIVILGIMALTSKRFPLIKYILLVLFATLFHSGAFIALLYVPFHYFKKLMSYGAAIIGISFVFLLFRGQIMSIIKSAFEKESMNANANVYIGLNFVFLAAFATVFVICAYIRENKLVIKALPESEKKMIRSDFEVISDKMFFLSIAVMLLLGSDTSARSYMFFNQVIIIKMANFMDDLISRELKDVVMVLLTAFLVVFFFYNSLLPNSFYIVPYKFFWQA